MELDRHTKHARESSAAAASNALAPGKRTLTERLPVPRGGPASTTPGKRTLLESTSGVAQSQPTQGAVSASAVSGSVGPAAGELNPTRTRPTIHALFGRRVPQDARADAAPFPGSPPVPASPSSLPGRDPTPARGDAPPEHTPAERFASATAGSASEVPYRNEMEQRFGESFSAVSAYLGRHDQLLPLAARAATYGGQVAFAEANPSREVVAHELAHVVQSRCSVAGRVSGVAPVDCGAEREADALASSAADCHGVRVRETATSGLLHLARHGTTLSQVSPTPGSRSPGIPANTLVEVVHHDPSSTMPDAVLIEYGGEQYIVDVHELAFDRSSVDGVLECDDGGQADAVGALGSWPGPASHAPQLPELGTIATMPPGGSASVDRDLKLEDGGELRAELEKYIALADWDHTIRPGLYVEHAIPILQRVPQRMTGVGSRLVIEQFLQGVERVQKSWGDFQDGQARANALLEACNTALAQIGVPSMKCTAPRDMSAHGRFRAHEWGIAFREQTMELSVLEDRQVRVIADNALHETRHCEQHFRAARYLAGQGVAADEIAERLGIPDDVASEAVLRPLRPNPANPKEKEPGRGDDPFSSSQELLEASQWVQEQTGERREHNHEIGRVMDHACRALNSERELAQDLLNDLQKSSTPENIKLAIYELKTLKELIQAIEEAYADYRALPLEMDAHEVGVITSLHFDRRRHQIPGDPALLDETRGGSG
jgi:hypothetical protein